MATRSYSGLPGTVKPRAHGVRSLLTQRTFRRGIQLAFLTFIVVLAFQHALAGEESLTAASPEAYCPFGGLETLFSYLGSGGTFIAHTHLSNLVLLASVLLTALLLRSAFCGWVCPLGFLQDLISNLSSVLQKRAPRLRRMMTRLKINRGLLGMLDRYLRLLKYGVLAWAVIGAGTFGVMVFRDYDPWATILNLAEFSLTPGAIILGITLAASFFVERPWCRYACPLGAASGLVSKLSPVYLKREENACKTCRLCTKACPMGLPVHTADKIRSVDCIGCLDCVSACPRNGALEVKVGLPLIGQ